MIRLSKLDGSNVHRCLFLLHMHGEHVSVNKCLDFILDDAVILHRMTQHFVEQELFRIVGLTYPFCMSEFG